MEGFSVVSQKEKVLTHVNFNRIGDACFNVRPIEARISSFSIWISNPNLDTIRADAVNFSNKIEEALTAI